MTIHPCRLPRVARSGALINTAFSWPNGLVRPIWERLQRYAFVRMSEAYRSGRGRGVSACRDDYGALAFRELGKAVDTGEGDFFAKAAGPKDFDLVDFRSGAEAEMDTRVGRRSVAGPAEDIGALANAASGEEYFGANGVAGRFVRLGFRD